LPTAPPGGGDTFGNAWQKGLKRQGKSYGDGNSWRRQQLLPESRGWGSGTLSGMLGGTASRTTRKPQRRDQLTERGSKSKLSARRQGGGALVHQREERVVQPTNSGSGGDSVAGRNSRPPLNAKPPNTRPGLCLVHPGGGGRAGSGATCHRLDPATPTFSNPLAPRREPSRLPVVGHAPLGPHEWI